jgi:hypothetical protein
MFFASVSTIKRRVGVSPGYPPVGAAHYASMRTLRLPHVSSRDSNTFFKTFRLEAAPVLKKVLEPRLCENVTQVPRV